MIALTCTVQEDSTYWRPAQTSDAIFDQMSKDNYIEIPLSTVKKEHKLGEGEFGEVFKREWTTPAKTLTVALKSLKSSASEEERLNSSKRQPSWDSSIIPTLSDCTEWSHCQNQ